MTPRPPRLRLPAEWEQHSFTQLTWPSPKTDWAYMLDEAVGCFKNILQAIADREPVLVVTDSVEWLRSCTADMSFAFPVWAFGCPINDTWARDHSLICLERPDGGHDLLDFTFNGWGLKFAADKDNQINRHLCEGPLRSSRAYHLTTILEGGSIESDGHGALMSSSMCLLAPNRNGYENTGDAIGDLAPIFQPLRFHFVESGQLPGDDTDGHIDTIARFAPGGTIVYVANRDVLSDLRTFSDADGNAYRLVELPQTPKILDPDSGEQLPATYANFYFAGHDILVPTYNVPTDAEALKILTDTFAPMGFGVVGIDCRALIRQHGSLHCSTMQFPQGIELDTAYLIKL